MIKLYKGDCLIKSDKIENGSVDLILTDLPYGTMKTRDYSIQPNQKEGSKTAQDHQWDSVIDTDKIMQIANRILRIYLIIILVCGKNQTLQTVY